VNAKLISPGDLTKILNAPSSYLKPKNGVGRFNPKGAAANARQLGYTFKAADFPKLWKDSIDAANTAAIHSKV
jgi:hypothetical protein